MIHVNINVSAWLLPALHFRRLSFHSFNLDALLVMSSYGGCVW